LSPAAQQSEQLHELLAGGRHEISEFATGQSEILPFVAAAAIRTSHAASPPTTRI